MRMLPYFLVLCGTFALQAQTDSLWRRTGSHWSLNDSRLRETLSRLEARPELAVPSPEGGLLRFRIWETEVLGPELARRFPEIRTLAGEGIDDPSSKIRLTVANEGLRGVVVRGGEHLLIHPAPAGGGLYESARLRDVVTTKRMVTSCKTPTRPMNLSKLDARAAAVDLQALPHLRVFRMAIATTANLTKAAGGTMAGVMAVVTNAMNLVNSVFEREAAVRFRVVAVLATTDQGDPLQDDDVQASLEAGQALFDEEVGAANYDIGHVFALAVGNGQAGDIGILCERGKKGQGFSDFGYGDSNPEIVALDMISHEIGHQMGAHHTFNATCGGNAFESSRAEENAVEVGSGATIMGYTGNCLNEEPPNQDLDSVGNGHFHIKSIEQIIGEVRKREGCQAPAVSSRTNRPPAVQTADQFVIPARTPFGLLGQATDPDEEDRANLTYSWEQVDIGKQSSPPNTDDGTVPLFRNYSPVKTGGRIFPALPYILLTANQPPLTVNIEGKDYLLGESLPQVGRTMTFRLLVRDNRKADDSVAGSFGVGETKIQVVGDAGPFRVTAPADGVTAQRGQNMDVTWDVARTDQAPINSARVNIRLFVAENQPLVTLAEGVPNNGRAQVTIPAGAPATATGRIVVESADNIFFDFSDFNIRIN